MHGLSYHGHGAPYFTECAIGFAPTHACRRSLNGLNPHLHSAITAQQNGQSLFRPNPPPPPPKQEHAVTIRTRVRFRIILFKMRTRARFWAPGPTDVGLQAPTRKQVGPPGPTTRKEQEHAEPYEHAHAPVWGRGVRAMLTIGTYRSGRGRPKSRKLKHWDRVASQTKYMALEATTLGPEYDRSCHSGGCSVGGGGGGGGRDILLPSLAHP